ncbi:flagellar M-ring protein FliF [Bacillus sp. RG28]|uniref:Flagellar M-ring protein n=1 Tax=Gottfriedia endophytica TaxID=2820819 RepID=A0A940SHI9_9BACI|nr:flagellar basal-body MS-ring/collar protein FliF [Gottfriedia endophytica]MBP0726242.1 flagellar M-ring protein FliF [Gottfriedia endophytica]
MNEKLNESLNRIKSYWKSRTQFQKGLIIGIPLILALIIGITTYFLTKVNYVPLYSNLTPAETGQIKQTLDSQGVSSEIQDNGKTIYVPDNVVDSLKVDLAAKGIPDSGTIDYSFFSKNSNFSMTDNEFNVLKLEAMQNELANLMKQIDGVNNAKVMINLPQQSLWVSDQNQTASASIVLDTKPGYNFTPDQITALYHLVSKSIPNLPTDNIVITNQNFEYIDLPNQKNNSTANTYDTQQEVRKNVERDIQRQVQQLLGTMIGQNKVAVGVTADIDFTQEAREENLVEPVDKTNMQGIAVSAERIKEAYVGGKPATGGVAGTGTPDTTTYQSSGSSNNGDYSRSEERINYDVNRIKRKIVESPYKIRDLGIQVAVEPPNPKNPNSLPQQTINDIKQMLGTIVSTSIDKSYIQGGTALTPQQVGNKIAVSVLPFNGNTIQQIQPQSTIPVWMYIVGGVLLLVILLLIILLLRKKRNEEVLVEDLNEEDMIDVPDINDEQETDSTVRRKQLERMAKDKPDEFAKLLRSWLAED